MWFNSIDVRVVTRAGNPWLLGSEAVGEVSRPVQAEQFTLEIDPHLLRQFVFEAAGRPSVYSVSTTVRYLEEGSSSVLGEILIEVLGDAEMLGWAVLAEIVAQYLLDEISRQRNDD